MSDQDHVLLVYSEADRARILQAVALQYGQTTKAVEQGSRATGGLTGALGQLSGGYGTVTRLAGLFGVSLGAGALVAYAKHVVETVGGLGELAEQLGVTTQSLQVYEFHGSQAGLKSEEMQASVARLTRTIGEAADGDDKAIKAFTRLGVGILDVNGKVRSTDAVFADLAKAISGLDDPAARGAAAVDFFSKSGQKLLPLLSEIATRGMPALTKAAEDAGAVVSDKLIQDFDKASDAMARFGKQSVVVAAEVIAAMSSIVSASADLSVRAVSPWVNYFARLGNLYMDWVGSPMARLLRGDNPFSAAPAATPKGLFPGINVPIAGTTPPPAATGPTSNPMSDKQNAQEQSLRKYIAALEDEARAIREGDAERAISKALREADAKLVDEQGKRIRELTPKPAESVAP